ncbi:MAG: hypothetical protein WC846_02705 [Candidatus Gracilibacteria bacterium]|jgi:hypothetical protein
MSLKQRAAIALTGLTLGAGCGHDYSPKIQTAPQEETDRANAQGKAARANAMREARIDTAHDVKNDSGQIRQAVLEAMKERKEIAVQTDAVTARVAKQNTYFWNYGWFANEVDPDDLPKPSQWECPLPIKKGWASLQRVACPQMTAQGSPITSLSTEEEKRKTDSLCGNLEAAPLCLPEKRQPLSYDGSPIAAATFDGIGAVLLDPRSVASLSPDQVRDLLAAAYFAPDAAGERYTAGTRIFSDNPPALAKQVEAGTKASNLVSYLTTAGTVSAEEAETSALTDDILEAIPHEGTVTVEKGDSDGIFRLQGKILLPTKNENITETIISPSVVEVEPGEGDVVWKLKQGQTIVIERKEKEEEAKQVQVTIGPDGTPETSTQMEIGEINKMKQEAGIGADEVGNVIVHSDSSVDWTGNITTPHGDVILGQFPVTKRGNKWEVTFGAEHKISLIGGEFLTCTFKNNGKVNYALPAELTEGENTKTLMVASKGDHWTYSGDGVEQKYTFSPKEGLNVTR